MRIPALVVLVLIAATPGCGMLHVKEQQAKIDAFCAIGGRVEAERRDTSPLIVVLARHTGGDPQQRDSWQIADHFVLEAAGQWQFHAAAGTYGLVAFQDLNGDLKAQPGEPYLRIERERLVTCQGGERKTDIVLRIPAAGRSRLGNETIDVGALQARSVGDQFAVSLSQVTAVGEIASLSDPRFADAIANSGLWQPFDFLFKGGPGVYFLEPYDRKKTPVLFVHGINGSPTNFTTLIER